MAGRTTPLSRDDLLTPRELGRRRIEQLTAAGHDTSWYTAQDRPDDARVEAPSTCGYFSIYILDGEWSYTKTHDGRKYLPFKRLKQPVAVETAYCNGCHKRWATVAEAMAHLTAVGELS